MVIPKKDFFDLFKSTPGALSVCESICIMSLASIAPEGRYIELGVYLGKSAISTAYTLKRGTFVLVDPMFEDQNVVQSVSDTIRSINDKLTLSICNGYSIDEIPKYGKYAYVMVDSGSHQDGIPMQEVKLLEHLVVKNGVVVFHDFNSQFKEVREAYDYLVQSGDYEPIAIDWSEIVNHVSKHNLEDGNNSWHHNELQYPCFVGALKRK